jgi:hypothetical protein
MASPRSFAKKMRAFADDIPKQQNAIKIALATEGLTNVHGDTPVDSGRARDGWIASVGSANTSYVPQGPYGPSVHRGTNAQRAENATRQRGFPTRAGTGAINKSYNEIKGAKYGEPVYLNNNVEYIGELNKGHSKQAPRNFFQIAIERSRGILRRQLIRYRGY